MSSDTSTSEDSTQQGHPTPPPERAGTKKKNACPLSDPQVGVKKRKLHPEPLNITYTHVYRAAPENGVPDSEGSMHEGRAAAFCRSGVNGDFSGLFQAIAADVEEESKNQKSEPCPLPVLQEGEVWRMNPNIQCTIIHAAPENGTQAAYAD
jgi:hypothetical protein